MIVGEMIVGEMIASRNEHRPANNKKERSSRRSNMIKLNSERRVFERTSPNIQIDKFLFIIAPFYLGKKAYIDYLK